MSTTPSAGQDGRKPYWIVAVYATASVLWILFSDNFLESLSLSPHVMTRIQTVKGWMFVVLTSLLILVLLRRHELARAAQARLLAESERKYRRIFENAPAGIFRTNPQGRFLDMNGKLADMLGYSSADEALASIRDLATDIYTRPEERGKVLSHIRDQAGDIPFECEFRRKNGEIFISRISARLLPGEGDVPAIVEGVAEDVTEMRRRERETLLLRNLLTNVVDAMPSALAAVNADGKVILWNRAAEQYFGLDAGMVMGLSLAETMPDIGQELELVRSALEAGSVRRLSRRARLRQGVPVVEDVAVYPFETGEARAAVLRFDDVTEQVRMEDLLIQSEKMLSVGELASGMAHEINNPLGGIAQSAQVVLRRINQETPASTEAAQAAGCDLAAIRDFLVRREVPDMLESIRQEAFKASRIVNNLLGFSGGSSTKSATDLAGLMDKALEMAAGEGGLTTRHGAHAIAVSRDYAQDMPQVWVNPSEMEQVFLGLVRNAAQAFPAEGTGKAPEIRVTLGAKGGRAIIQVSDNGPGMDEHTRRRVFEPFFTTKPPGEGTGLGLAVAYFIVSRNHQGSIHVESKPGQGATFTVSLPLVPITPGGGI